MGADFTPLGGKFRRDRRRLQQHRVRGGQHRGAALAGQVKRSFTVSAYPTDSALTIVVGEGSVVVRSGEASHSVPAGAGLVVRDDGASHVASASERDEGAGWKTGTLAVENRSLKDALALMKRWYGYEIRVPTPALLDRKVTMRVSLDSGMQAIRLVEKSSGLEFGYAGQNMVYREKGATKAKKK